MISSDHQDIILSHLLQNSRQLLIEIGQRLGITIHIISVTIDHIRIYQIRKEQAFEIIIHPLDGLLDTIRITGRTLEIGNTSASEDINDLTDAQGIIIFILQHIQHGSTGRIQGEIMPLIRQSRIMTALTCEGSRNDSAYAMLSYQDLPGDLAVTIEFLYRNNVLMCCNLEDRICRSIDNQCPASYMFIAVICDDLGTGIGTVYKSLPASLLFKGFDYLLGEAIGVGRHRTIRYDTCHLPMTGCRILAFG